MLEKSAVVTTTERQYTLDTLEQFCAEPEHGTIIQRYDSKAGKIVDEVVQGDILSVVVVD